MSGVYPKVREQLLSWAYHHTSPATVAIKVVGVSAAYAYNVSHNEINDLGATVVTPETAVTAPTFTDGILDAEDTVFEGLTPGPTLAGLVVYFSWTGGSQLICFIDASTDASLPQVIASSSYGIHWNPAGICLI